MNHRMITIFAAASAISLAAAGCSSKTDDNVAAGDAMSGGATDMASAAPVNTALAADSHGAMFLTDAMKGDNTEVKLGQLAIAQGSSAAVRDFGKMLVADHGKHVADLGKLGMTMGVDKTDAISPAGDAAYAKLKALTGAEFDTEFAAQMVKDHEQDIAKYEAEAASKDAAALTDMARQTLPTLKLHLAKARSLPS